MKILELSEDLRVKIDQFFHQQIAILQKFNGKTWEKVTKRSYEVDIRINIKGDMERVAEQKGLL